MVTIAYLGPAGTYSEMAVLQYRQRWGTAQTQLLPCNTIQQAMTAVATAQVELAIVPLENSLQGSVSMTLDGLWQWQNIQIQQVLVLPIRHHLLSFAKSLDQIDIIYSHSQGLGQCQQWLLTHLPHARQQAVDSTSQGVQMLRGQARGAAIASQRSAEIYQVPILWANISDHWENYTRFAVLKVSTDWQEGRHSSWGFSFSHNRAGTLVKALHSFADRHINLTRIESRPSKRSLGDYIFFVDIEGSITDPVVQSAWAQLETMTENLRHFGSYHTHMLS
jgi:prephenate dehydratase